MAEQSPRIGSADLTPADVFYNFTAALTARNWGGDSHRIITPVPIIEKDTQTNGTLQLNDYLSFESKEYPRRPAGSHEAGHRHVLEAGVAILGLQLSIGRQSMRTSYLLCIPDSVKEDSAAGFYFYGIHDEGVQHIKPLAGMPIDPSVPTILRNCIPESGGGQVYDFVYEPATDRQLVAAYTTITATTL